MSVADEFDKALNQGMVGLNIDDWAITKVREQAQPSTQFSQMRSDSRTSTGKI